MDEQRFQAYLELIQALLNCPNGQENNILNAGAALIDDGLIAVMVRVAENLQADGQVGRAGLLTDIARQLANYLQHRGYRDKAQTPEALLNFLMEVLQAVSDDPSPQAIYPLLAANQEKLNLELADVLRTWAEERLASLEPSLAYSIAAYVGNFGSLLKGFPMGNKMANIEVAISAYKSSLSIFNKERYASAWAMTQNKLASAYKDRIRGDRAENIELAIAAYKLALEVYTRDDFPTDWASTQSNLADAYYKRIQGDFAENIEAEIVACNLALEVYTRNDSPEMWAERQHNLAAAYSERIRGDRTENIELGIRACYLALEIYTRDDFPTDWASTLYNLANNYQKRIRGDRAENIESAIVAYNLALEVFTRDDFPEKWALIQNDLAVAYSERIRGDRAENIESAIVACNLALKLRTRDDFPADWAMTQNNLAAAYQKRIRGDRAENIEAAIASHNLALEVYTRDDFPDKWALIQNNLTAAYSEHIRGDRAENTEAALVACNLALEVFTRNDFPADWAMAQNNLASAYNNRIRGDRAENIELAIAAYNLALEVYTPSALPQGYLHTGLGLGNLGFMEGMWEIAVEGYEKAIEAVEYLRVQSLDEKRREEIHASAIGVYSNIVQAYVNLAQYDKAMEYVDRSRSQRLVELMASNDLYRDGNIPEEVRVKLTAYEAKQREIDGLRNFLNSDGRSLMETATRQIRDNRAQSEAVKAEIAQRETEKQAIWQELRRLDPIIASQTQVDPLDFAAMQALLADKPHSAVLCFFSNPTDTHIFILRGDDKQPQYFRSGERGDASLNGWIAQNWLNLYLTDRMAWQAQMPQFLEELANCLQINLLIASHLQNINELILIPHLYLHQIPFGALPISDRGDGQPGYLGDRFKLRYTPSMQILKFCQARRLIPFEEIQQTFGTAENATEDLIGSGFEGEQVAQMLEIGSDRRLLGRQGATTAAYRQLLQQSQAVLSAHHAKSDLDNPLQSYLRLGNGTIALGELLLSRFPDLSDVFLSCCETGLGTHSTLTDDIVTLGIGFLSAGARTVISSLWAVDDMATAIFSILYHQNRQRGLSAAIALQTAQQELRYLTGKQLETDYKAKIVTYLEAIHLQYTARKAEIQAQLKILKGEARKPLLNESGAIADRFDKIEKTARSLDALCQCDRPFAACHYWAAFTCQGIG
jgi:CHAT domain-containing protein